MGHGGGGERREGGRVRDTEGRLYREKRGTGYGTKRVVEIG